MLDDMLGDRITCLVSDEGVQKRLHSETNLNFSRLLDILRSKDMAFHTVSVATLSTQSPYDLSRETCTCNII